MRQQGWRVTFSLGAATFVKAPSSVDEMISITDHLMYRVKNSGKNGLVHETLSL